MSTKTRDQGNREGTSLTCEQARAGLADFDEGQLGDAQQRVVAQHLGQCADCESERKAMARLRSILRALPAATPPAELRGAVMARIAREAAPNRATGRARSLVRAQDLGTWLFGAPVRRFAVTAAMVIICGVAVGRIAISPPELGGRDAAVLRDSLVQPQAMPQSLSEQRARLPEPATLKKAKAESTASAAGPGEQAAAVSPRRAELVARAERAREMGGYPEAVELSAAKQDTLALESAPRAPMATMPPAMAAPGAKEVAPASRQALASDVRLPALRATEGDAGALSGRSPAFAERTREGLAARAPKPATSAPADATADAPSRRGLRAVIVALSWATAAPAQGGEDEIAVTAASAEQERTAETAAGHLADKLSASGTDAAPGMSEEELEAAEEQIYDVTVEASRGSVRLVNATPQPSREEAVALAEALRAHLVAADKMPAANVRREFSGRATVVWLHQQ